MHQLTCFISTAAVNGSSVVATAVIAVDFQAFDAKQDALTPFFLFIGFVHAFGFYLLFTFYSVDGVELHVCP